MKDGHYMVGYGGALLIDMINFSTWWKLVVWSSLQSNRSDLQKLGY